MKTTEIVEAEIETEPRDLAAERQVVGDPVHLGELRYRFGIAKVSLKSMPFFLQDQVGAFPFACATVPFLFLSFSFSFSFVALPLPFLFFQP